MRAEIKDCAGLVALANTLSESVEDAATCELIQTHSVLCGCPAISAAQEGQVQPRQACTSLCFGGEAPQNLEAELPVPGVGPISCELAASLIPSVPSITVEQCTAAQSAAFIICDCPTAPPPDVNLPCAFCLDGSLPANPDEVIDPTIPVF